MKPNQPHPSTEAAQHPAASVIKEASARATNQMSIAPLLVSPAPAEPAPKSKVERAQDILHEIVDDLSQRWDAQAIKMGLRDNDLMLAADQGNVTMVKQFLAAGVDPIAPKAKSEYSFGWTPLHSAAYHDHMEVAGELTKALMTQGKAPRIDLREDSRKDSPLMVAMCAGNVRTARVLIALGANPHGPNKFGETPAMEAARVGDVETLRLCTRHGARGEMRDINDENIVFKALTGPMESETRRLEVLKHLHSVMPAEEFDVPVTKDGYSILHIAAKMGYDEIIRWRMSLDEPKPQVNQMTETGLTPAMIAAHYDQASTLRVLKSYDADLDAIDRKGLTAAHLAAAMGSMNALEALKDCGAKLNVQAFETRQTPMDVAREFKSLNGSAAISFFAENVPQTAPSSLSSHIDRGLKSLMGKLGIGEEPQERKSSLHLR